MNPISRGAGFSICALLWLMLDASNIAVAQTPPRNATFRTLEIPSPAEQSFDAMFGVVMHSVGALLITAAFVRLRLSGAQFAKTK